MIDFHTHILPGIDDGAKDVSVSAAMLEMEKEQGVNDCIVLDYPIMLNSDSYITWLERLVD